jgi:hypothetical protein
VSKLLEAIYEQDFLGGSYGYRPEVGALEAVRDLSAALRSGHYHYLVEADIRGFFDECGLDATIGYLLHCTVAQHSVVYTIRDGDQPGVIFRQLRFVGVWDLK